MKVNERYYWALDKLDLTKGDNVLEIGFGAGILIDLMSTHPAGVRITGVDRLKTGKKNSRLEKVMNAYSHRVKLVYDDFSNVDFEPHRYSKLVAFNVPFFRKEGAPELAGLARLLARNGHLYVFYESPGSVSRRDVDRIENNLVVNGFEILESGFGPGRQKKWLFTISRPSSENA